MEILLASLNSSPVVVISPRDLETLLQEGEILREWDTNMSGDIRIIGLSGNLLVQEKTDKGEFTIRKMDSRDQADEFVQNRLDTYERMWDG